VNALTTAPGFLKQAIREPTFLLMTLNARSMMSGAAFVSDVMFGEMSCFQGQKRRDDRPDDSSVW